MECHERFHRKRNVLPLPDSPQLLIPITSSDSIFHNATLAFNIKGNTPGLDRNWYDDPQYSAYMNPADRIKGACNGRGGAACDEYPFFTTTHAGPPTSNLRPTSILEGRRQGGTITGFNSSRRVFDDDPFIVIPIPRGVRTQYICRGPVGG